MPVEEDESCHEGLGVLNARIPARIADGNGNGDVVVEESCKAKVLRRALSTLASTFWMTEKAQPMKPAAATRATAATNAHTVNRDLTACRVAW